MQEDQAITFQPIFEGHIPWFSRLFVLYALFVLVAMTGRLVNIGFKARKLGILLRSPAETEIQWFTPIWNECCSKVNSFKYLATVTLLLSILDLSMEASGIFGEVRSEKMPHLAYVLPALGYALTTFSFGVIVTIALYVGYILAQPVIDRRKREFDQLRATSRDLGV